MPPLNFSNCNSPVLDTDLNYMHRQVTQQKSYSGKKRFLARQLRKQRMQKLKLRRNQGRMTRKFARIDKQCSQVGPYIKTRVLNKDLLKILGPY